MIPMARPFARATATMSLPEAMPAPPPMKMRVKAPTISAMPRRKTLSSIEKTLRSGSDDNPAQPGCAPVPSEHEHDLVRDRVPALPQDVLCRDDRGICRPLSRLQVHALQALRPVRARAGAGPAR